MINTIDWYLGRTMLVYSLAALVVLVGLITLINFVDGTKDLGTGSFDMYQLVRYTILSVPQQLYELFPMAALLGTMLGLSSMAVHSELIVVRAAGYSLVQIAAAVLKIGSVFIIAAVVIGETVTPTTESEAQRGRAEALNESVKQDEYGVWMRDVNSFISVGEVLPDFTLKNLRVFEFDAENRMRSAVEARTAHYVVSEQIWELEQVRQSLFQEGNVQARQIREARWASVLAPEILSIFLVRPEQLSAFQLRQYIGHLQDNGQDTDRYELAFWHKLILPLSTGVMILVALPFVFSSLRSSSFGRSLFIGIMLGVGFFLANRSFGYFVQLYGVPPLLGALTPTLVFCAGAILALRRQA